jgi:hypothetical protein
VRLKRALRIESLERRDLLTTVLHLDATLVRQAGGSPIVLDQPNTVYVLDADIDAPGSAFVVAAPNVTLNLNGHRVTYGDVNPIQVVNGTFELTDGSGGLPGWDLSRAPSAVRVPALAGMFGQWMLHFNHITSTQSILSDPVGIPFANREYVAAITPQGPYDAIVTISVVDAVTGAVLATGTSPNPERGFAAVARFVPTTTRAVRLRIDVAPASGQSATINLDYAALVPSRDYGIVATQDWLGDLPIQLQTGSFMTNYRTAANFTVMDGQIVQGRGHGNASSPLFFNGLPGFTVVGVVLDANGMDTNLLDGNWGHDAVIANSIFQASIDRVTNRMNIVAAINLNNFDGTVSITGNHIIGVPQVGILISGMPTEQWVAIVGNDIRQHAIVTDGYGINMAGVQNLEVRYNTILPTSGRGILLDGWGRIPTQNGVIHDNYVDVFEAPNLEYGDRIEATGLRLRNWDATQRNLAIINNTFAAHTGPGGVWAAIGARISAWNDHGQETGANNLIENNVFRAIVTTTDPYYGGMAISLSNVGAGTGMYIVHNVLESNDIALNIGDSDSWQGRVDDVSMDGNIIRVSTAGPARTFCSIVAGGWETEVSNIRLSGTCLENDAPAVVVYAGSAVSDVSVTWQPGPAFDGDPTGGIGFIGWIRRFSHSVFAIGTDGQVQTETADSTGQWSGWSPTSPGVVKAISSVTDTNGTPQVFAIGLDNQIWTQTMNDAGQWSGWRFTAPGTVKAVSAILDANGRPEVFVIGMDDQVWAETSPSPGVWYGWSRAREGAVKAISVILDANENPQIFAIRPDNQVWTITSDGSWGWSTWTLTHTGRVKSIDAILDSNGQAQVFAIGMDDGVWTETAGAAGFWSPWTPTQSGTVKDLTVFTDPSGQTEVAAIGMDNQVWAEVCTAAGQWSPWTLTQPGAVSQLAR